ncbi:hypothetical protein DJ58_4374 [Yersinia frederiksenii ATCC 33641]|uniref:Uncharacterized protein n=1 Tax=Yersinia frederiksenii ATCC 33641 TaxID=349966 RepID=A0ABR4VWL4_YERFR|nr:hypothetical protein DJ58_4374 [Yersinia frederiksenii ATCC 33641]
MSDTFCALAFIKLTVCKGIGSIPVISSASKNSQRFKIRLFTSIAASLKLLWRAIAKK